MKFQSYIVILYVFDSVDCSINGMIPYINRLFFVHKSLTGHRVFRHALFLITVQQFFNLLNIKYERKHII